MKILTLGTILLLFSGCYVSKQLEITQFVKIYDEFVPTVSAAGPAKYIYNGSTYDFKDAYMGQLRKSMLDNNVSIAAEGDRVDYALVIRELVCTETTTHKTIKDSASAQLGEVYDLQNCKVEAKVTFYEGDKEIENKKWNIPATRAEKLKKIKAKTSDGKVLTGPTYKLTELSDSTFVDISRIVGRRTAASITKQITKLWKK